jgi:hypothetical protein
MTHEVPLGLRERGSCVAAAAANVIFNKLYVSRVEGILLEYLRGSRAPLGTIR